MRCKSAFVLAVIAGLILLVLLTPGCLMFSSFQSARIVEPGKPTSTISVARNNFLESGDHDPGWTILEFRNRAGLGSNVDAAFKVSAARLDESGGVVFILGGDVRAALWKDHLAVALPLQVTAGDFEFRGLQLYPGLIGTVPLSDRLEVNASGNVYIFARANELSAYTYSLGLGIRPTDGSMRLRPEVAWLRLSDGDRLYRQLGLAIEFPIRSGS